MGSKRRSKRGRTHGGHVNNSFANLVSEQASKQALKLLKNNVNVEIQRASMQISNQYGNELAGLVTRLSAIENIIMREFNISDEVLAEEVATVEDTALGLVKTDTPVEKGDTVRVTVVGKLIEDEEYKTKPARLQVSDVANGKYSLPDKIEDSLIGKSTGDEYEVEFTDTNIAKVIVERVSRRIENEESDSSEG